MKKEFSVILFSLILLSSSILANSQAFAHNNSNPNDPPGAHAPKIKVKVILESIKLNENQDDPIDAGEAELVFSYVFNHKGHDENFKDHKDYDHNYMDYRLTTCHSESRPDSTWSCYRWFEEPVKNFRNEVLYEHIECSEMSPITYTFDLRESDQSTANTVIGGATTVAGAALAFGPGGWVVTGKAVAVAGIATFIAGLNGDDHLGIKNDTIEKPQSNIVTKLKGDDGGAEIRWSVITEPVDDPNGECLPKEEKEVASSIQIPTTDQFALAASVDDFISSSKDVIRLNSDSQKEEGLTETTDLEFEQLKQKTPSIVVDYADAIYDTISSESDSTQKSIANDFALEAQSLASQGKYIESLDKYEDAFLAIYDIEPKEESSLPQWIKTSAQWWADGIVSDREFATSLAFLVKEQIVQVDNVEVDSQGTIAISDNIAIPQWIRNNADWWVAGAISDNDFKQGIQFMMKEEIISFKEKQKQIDTIEISQDFIFNLYKEQKWNELAFTYLLETKNLESEIFDEASDAAWDIYSEEKTSENQELAQKMQTLKDKTDTDLKNSVSILKNTQQQITSIEEIANKINIPILELEKSVEQQEILIESVRDDLISINDGYVKAQDALKKAKSEKDMAVFHLNVYSPATITSYNFDTKITNIPGEELKVLEFTIVGENSEITRINTIAIDLGSIEVSSHSDTGNLVSQGDDIVIGVFNILGLGQENVSVTSIGIQFSSNDELGKDMVEQGEDDFDSIADDLQKIVVLDLSEPSEVRVGDEQDDIDGTEVEIDEGGEMEQLSSLTILEIGGVQYPISQFTLWQWDGECDNAWHYHTNSGHAVNLELTGIEDPDPENCGFGKVSEVPSYNTWLTQSQVDAFYELTGVNPAGNEAQMGGSGP
ncbi:hypothetical protein Nisw_08110 [Candidatus Nitrosopumilus sp. SW]|uniref:hypothetical protein n=1 Tax=Candidatus Nitrosopumilus sp. SW TaxID=2508726 RepID=UPI00115332C5|nr:hypothetical protein [Candidatus Nitrosopumilus sp. SW]QDI89488.1 hypothetical protein Nisw_08110 [Candidatus Nitrosopumilus sp. SW]